MGRPSKYSDETARRIVDAIAAGSTRETAAAYAGIDGATLFRWLHRYASFASALKQAEAQAEIGHVAVIAQAARAGDWRASAFWLERRRHPAWGRKDRLEVVTAVRALAREHGLSDVEEQEAVAEATRLLREYSREPGGE